MKSEKINRIGEENYTKKELGNYKMKIVEYNNAGDIWIEFQDKYKIKIHTTYKHFKDGGVKNPYHPDVYDIGYLGQGEYKAYIRSGVPTLAYSVWQHMLQRCYDSYWMNKHLTYIDCSVCKEWHNFQNFAKWFYENYYEVREERMHLDKDILYKDSKIYSSKTCIFVPQRINVLFTKSEKIRGKYPIGVSYHKNKDMLVAQCSIFNEKIGKKKPKHLGYFSLNKPFQAFYCYKQFKENYIKQIADEYKDLIPKKLYDAMYRYEVEIND